MKWIKYQKKISKETNLAYLYIILTSVLLTFFNHKAVYAVIGVIIMYFLMVYLLYRKLLKANASVPVGLNEYTIEQFRIVPHVGWNENVTDFDSLIIIPTDQVHDSGYMCMEFIACKKETPIARISGCSDVIHINGIGGYGIEGIRFRNELKKPVGWSIDCLKTSGCLRLFSDGKLQSGTALSSFEIF